MIKAIIDELRKTEYGCKHVLFEPAGTVNTGNIRNDFTRDIESI